MKWILGLVVVLLVLGGAYLFLRPNPNPSKNSTASTQSPKEDPISDNTDSESGKAMGGEIDYDFTGTLSEIGGGCGCSGMAHAKYDSGGYVVAAEFENLPELEQGYFYEGWVVRKSPQSVISTGKLAKSDGKYTNVYPSEKDLTDHDFYVLTIEPDDGDPAPAEHVLEGTLNPVQ
ncbi:anti-sigma factor [Patescibacteria group bacterium]